MAQFVGGSRLGHRPGPPSCVQRVWRWLQSVLRKDMWLHLEIQNRVDDGEASRCSRPLEDGPSVEEGAARGAVEVERARLLRQGRILKRKRWHECLIHLHRPCGSMWLASDGTFIVHVGYAAHFHRSSIVGMGIMRGESIYSV